MKAYQRFKRCIGQGNLWLYVVSILNKRGPLHGYAIIQELRKFGFYISTVYGYVLLKRMVMDGVLKEVEVGGRKLYTVSEAAQENFKKAMEDLKNLVQQLT
ncbi:transcriptional regulator, PadR family [Pyrobaculum islandicum DSM 4184]|uniref:Transcriptional regulator, PadR family n=1 Tax=Pyrobaculum islandicum (strain DSM 4184 / JCM 9189 / GEO3) TaxID=384616 RepID=A1RV86_PYRIL|nr:PadR family transcriptional regulator [Pyrobaculum islandicum]ABL88868.1 transcriptional regulator, PadR family [Pyrobaculum islandicum DSM 4184]